MNRVTLCAALVSAMMATADAHSQTLEPAAAVRGFYDNISSNKNPDRLLSLFLTPETTVTGISGGAGRDRIYSITAREFVAAAKRQNATPHVVDSLSVTTLGESLASATVHFHTDHVKCKAVFTLTREGGDWRIASYVWETRLPEAQAAPATPKQPGAVPIQYELEERPPARVGAITLPPSTVPSPAGAVPAAPAATRPVSPTSSTPIPLACCPPSPPRSMKLTVANVCKEPALLFEMAENGTMTFIQKLPPGEAVDVKTTAEKRLVAIFPDKPAGESFDPTQANAVWLLRLAAQAGTTCDPARHNADPQARIKELLNQSKDLRQIEYEWERIWFQNQPSHLTPERVHGGIQ